MKGRKGREGKQKGREKRFPQCSSQIDATEVQNDTSKARGTVQIGKGRDAGEG